MKDRLTLASFAVYQGCGGVYGAAIWTTWAHHFIGYRYFDFWSETITKTGQNVRQDDEGSPNWHGRDELRDKRGKRVCPVCARVGCGDCYGQAGYGRYLLSQVRRDKSCGNKVLPGVWRSFCGDQSGGFRPVRLPQVRDRLCARNKVLPGVRRAA